MAKIEFSGLETYQKQLDQLNQAEIEGMLKYAIYPAASIVVDEIKKDVPVDTGDLRDSIGLKKFQNKDGFIYTEVEFAGKDRKGVRNALKARVLESGRSNMKKRPFIAKATRRAKKAAESMMQRMIDEYLQKKFGK